MFECNKPGCSNAVVNPPTSASRSLSSLDFFYCQTHLEELGKDDYFDPHEEPLTEQFS